MPTYDQDKIRMLMTRRDFIRSVALASAGMAIVACAPVQPGGAPAASGGGAAATTGGATKTVLGDALPADAAAYDQQIYRAMVFTEPQHMERAAGVGGSGSYYPFYTTEPLTKINENLELVGAVAESWKLEDDGLTWTFKIRPGLQWSDGQPLTAKDVEFTYQRIANPKVAFDWSWFFTDIENLSDVAAGKKDAKELGVKLVDDMTIQFKMTAPAPYFPDKTLMVTISPAHVIKAVDGPVDWSTKPETAVASGPFKLAKWDKGKEIVFVANDKYTGVFKPFLKEIRLIVGSQDAVMAAYEAGDIDAVAYEGLNISPADIARAKEDPAKWGLHFYDDWGTYMLVFNNAMKPFDNTKLRQAIARAIDKNALAQSAGRDLSTPAFALLGPGFPAHNPDLKNVNSFDVAAAKQLLADAGYPDGKGLEGLTCTTWGPLNPVRKGWIEGVLGQLKTNINLDIKLDVQEINTFYTQKAKHVYPFTFQQYQYDYIDPSNMLALFTTGRYDYSNPDYDKLIKEADHFTGSRDDRMKLYQQAEKILVEDAGGVFLFWARTAQFWRAYIKGKSLEPNKDGIVAFRGNKLGLTHYTMYITKDRPAIS
ncbi:MAG: peptide ABC transporter substrate-binding protein [Caldilineaceae bacterium]